MLELGSRTLAFLDVETTGLSTWFGDRICEIAILRCRGGEILSSFDTLVNPQRPISPGAARVNGITDAELLAAPLFAAIAAQVKTLLEDAILVAHNAPFDLGFVGSELARLGQGFSPTDVIDTLQLARQHFNFASNGLQAIAKSLGIQPAAAHRAMADVLTTRAVLEKFQAQLAGVPLEPFAAVPPEFGPDLVILDLPPLLQEALDSKKDLLIAYVDQRGNETRRRITPREVRPAGDYIYLFAHCHLRNEDRSFRLDRITEISLGEL